MKGQAQAVLEVDGLQIAITGIPVLRGVTLRVEAGRTLAVVGESGCGKSLSARAIMGLLEPSARVSGGSVRFMGCELLGLSRRELDRLRGDRIAMVFQDPMGALNPTMPVGDQIAETLVAHRGTSWRAARKRAVELLERTHVAEPQLRARQYPLELSGGMLQRAVIALAIACGPALLIADEPTTALDATVQEQILDLLAELQRAEGMAMLLITHDLGVVARMADDVAVMYAGQVVEAGPVESLFSAAAHPYTLGLRDTRPRLDAGPAGRLRPIPGSPPRPQDIAGGCAFAPRCVHAMRICVGREPGMLPPGGTRQARCWLQHPAAPLRENGPARLSGAEVPA